MTQFIFIYRDYYDFPRCMLIKHDNITLMLSSPFIEEIDNYQPWYDIFSFDDVSELELLGSWNNDVFMKNNIGKLFISEITFDASKRKWFVSSRLEKMIAARQDKAIEPESD